ncbi:Maf family protein [Auritidibacter ignavus]|uniref:Maf family protein n=1 Tax=Auritidibacter ignavus TaxID=678932 RepID=UPI00244BACA9|nr:nucleoside triphosphate pyrophosphatase [Auritidibacter ignavus]WGH84822.1 Maf family protein [Auritidibacter ignavus]
MARSQHPEIILASGSSARAQVLARAALPFTQRVSDIDEPALVASQNRELTPVEIPELLAQAKGRAVATEVAQETTSPTLILAADSVFEFNSSVYGKPHEPEIAIERWRAQQGQSGTLHTGHWLGLLHPEKPGALKQQVITDSAEVEFAAVDEQTILDYVATGEPLGCAGGFTLEARGASLIQSVQGDPNTVLGLSLRVVRESLQTWGYRLSDWWD